MLQWTARLRQEFGHGYLDRRERALVPLAQPLRRRRRPGRHDLALALPPPAPGRLHVGAQGAALLHEHRPRFQPFTATEREYLHLFAKAGSAPLVGEASPSYVRDPASPAAIHEASPNARVVVVVRHAGDLEFLEVDPDVATELCLDVMNPDSRPRNGVAARVYSGTGVRLLAKRVIPERFHGRLERVALERSVKPPLEPELRRLIAEACVDDVRRLERILGRPLPWQLERDLGRG